MRLGVYSLSDQIPQEKEQICRFTHSLTSYHPIEEYVNPERSVYGLSVYPVRSPKGEAKEKAGGMSNCSPSRLSLIRMLANAASFIVLFCENETMKERLSNALTNYGPVRTQLLVWLSHSCWT